MTSKKGREIHQRVEEAREDGRFLDALKFADEATIVYVEDGDLLGLAELQSSRQSTFKQLYRQAGDKNYLILEKHSAESAVEIAEKSGIKEALAIPYHNLGKYYEEAGKHRKAAEFFKKAVQNMKDSPPKNHNRPAVIADIEGHQFAAEYLAGDKNALKRAEQALKELVQSNEEQISKYNYNVWISGAHIRIATMLREDNPKTAKDHLQKAKEVINANPDLKLRKTQWEKLAETFLLN